MRLVRVPGCAADPEIRWRFGDHQVRDQPEEIALLLTMVLGWTNLGQ